MPPVVEFCDVARAADIPEADRLARTIRRWEYAVLAHLRSDGLGNARTQAVNVGDQPLLRGCPQRQFERA